MPDSGGAAIAGAPVCGKMVFCKELAACVAQGQALLLLRRERKSMKKNGVRFRRMLSGFCALLVCLCAAGCGAGGSGPKNRTEPVGTVSEEQDIILYAEALPAGAYTLRYEDAEAALEDFGEICTLEIGEDGADAVYEALIPQNCAPAKAQRIGVYNGFGERVGGIGLGSLKAEPGEVLYSFGVLSDVHIGYEDAEKDFQKALLYLTTGENVKFITVCGDLTAVGAEEQLETYRDLVGAFSDYTPVYEITGNHESYNSPIDPGLWQTYTGDPMYYSFEYEEDVFIMLGMATTTATKLMEEGQLQWLYETLEANRDKRCFLFTHVFPNNSSGNPYEAYENAIWMGVEETVLQSLLAHYPNVTMFHGHSHFEFDAQSFADTANFENASGFNSIHIPATVALRTLLRNGDGSVTKGEDRMEGSEGYVVDVCRNGILLRGREFAEGRFLPIAQYYIPTDVSTVAENTYWDPTDTVYTTYFENRISSSVKEDGTPYNGELGYRSGLWLSLSGEEIASETHAVTGFIPVTCNDILRIGNVAFDPETDEKNRNFIAFYDADKQPIGGTTLGFLFSREEEDGVWSTELPLKHRLSSVGEETAYFRIGADSLSGSSVVTVNQPIHMSGGPAEERNQIPLSLHRDGTFYNKGLGYRTGYRLSLSTGEEKPMIDHETTGFMPVTGEDLICIRHIPFDAATDEVQLNLIVFYDGEKNIQGGTTLGALFTQLQEDGSWTTGKPISHLITAVDGNTAYFRICAGEITEDSSIKIISKVEE